MLTPQIYIVSITIDFITYEAIVDSKELDAVMESIFFPSDIKCQLMSQARAMHAVEEAKTSSPLEILINTTLDKVKVEDNGPKKHW